MMDFKLYGKCIMCKLSKFFVRKRTLRAPKIGVNIFATSPGVICGGCYNKILKAQKEGKFTI